MVELVGLKEGRITERFDCFAGTSVKTKLASDVEPHGVNLFARR